MKTKEMKKLRTGPFRSEKAVEPIANWKNCWAKGEPFGPAMRNWMLSSRMSVGAGRRACVFGGNNSRHEYRFVFLT